MSMQPFVGIVGSFDRVLPTAVVSPSNGGTVSGTITVSAVPSDNDQVASVQLKIDGTNLGGLMTSGPYQQTGYDTHLLANGSHTFTAVVTDRVGNVATISNVATVSNSAPSISDLSFGDYSVWDDNDQTYYGGRNHIPEEGHKWDENAIWSSFGNLINTYHAIHSNPDSTHYQMRIQMVDVGIEGGSDGNHVHMTLDVNGTEYDVWDNGYTGANLINVSGTENVRIASWQSIPDWNTSNRHGIAIRYTFAVKAGYLS